MVMVKVRNPVATVLVGCLLMLALTTGAGDAFAQNFKERQPGASILKDEDFYRGIFLAQGPVAYRIPAIRDHIKAYENQQDPRAVRIITDFHNRLLDEIRSTDATFLSRFAVAMKSQDHYAIDEMITEGANVTFNAIQNLPEVISLRETIAKDPQYVNRLVDAIKADTNNAVDEAALRQAINLVAAGVSADARHQPRVDISVVVVALAVAAVVAATYVLVVHAAAAVFSVGGAVVLAVTVAAWTPWNKDMLAEEGLFREEMVSTIARQQF
jgi:hypothetical protein